MNLAGKKALVTGAARGIGRGCALELARAGADVAVNDRQRGAAAEAVVTEIHALGRQAALVEGDVFERASCASVVERAIEALGRLDVLVSNPACSRRGDFLDYDPETFDRVLQGTLCGGFHMAQLVARHLVERGAGGKIVFISSIHARVPYARSVAYNAAKSGLNHLAFTIAAELLPHRINVNVIEPGWIDTPGEHETFGSEAIRAAAPSLPWGRLGTPADIGKAAVFLCSSDADYITGTSLLVDGGLWLKAAHENVADRAGQNKG
jgi:glucose 1-dehydrogenase